MKKPLSFYENIKRQIQEKGDDFAKSCDQSVQKIKNLLDDKYNSTQQILTDFDMLCVGLKIDGNNHRAHLQKNQFKAQQMEKWIQIKKFALQLEQKDLQLAKELNQVLLKGKQSLQSKHKILINKQNDKKMRMDKVDEFIKNCQTPNQSISQTDHKRLYTPKSNQDPGLGIKFRPESKEIIIRIETFDRKVAEFILFYEEQEKRYCLKNPFKNLQSADLIAVKNFNIHNDELRLYEQLKAIVVKHIDNNEEQEFN